MRYYDRVYRQLVMALNDRYEAEDVTQEVFMRVHAALQTFDEGTASFRAWLQTITRNEGRRRLGQRARATVLASEEVLALRDDELQRLSSNDPADLFDRDELAIAERLPPPQRRVLVLRYVMDLEYDQIAQALGRSPEAVRMLEQRARASLRARLPRRGFDPPAGCRRMPMLIRLQPLPVMAGRRWALWQTPGGHKRW